MRFPPTQSQIIAAHHGFALLRQFWSEFVQHIDVIHLLLEPLVDFPGQPVTDQARLETPFLSSREACRAETVSTIHRFISSSAISRPVQWLIGRPAFSGFSQAICSIWHIWSAVRRGGVPGRGRFSRRSATLKSASEIGCKSNTSQNTNKQAGLSTIISCITSSLTPALLKDGIKFTNKCAIPSVLELYVCQALLRAESVEIKICRL